MASRRFRRHVIIVATPYHPAASAVEVSTALLSAAAWIEPRTVAPPPAAWLELRDTASAIRLAVQILRGPYATIVEGEMQARALEVLQSLEQSTRRLCDLVATVQPPANDAGPPAHVASLAPNVSAAPAVSVAPAVSAPMPAAAIPRLREATNAPAALAAVRAPTPAAVRPRATAAVRGVDVIDLLAKLEVVVGTRAAAALVLTIGAPTSLAMAVDGPELLRTLVLMVEDVASSDSVDLRVFLDPTEDLGEAMDVVFEVRARASRAAPSPSPALRAASDGLGGRLSMRRTSTTGALALRLPHAG
jgi:hypothetical protein